MERCENAVILPAKNEEKCIGAVIDELRGLPIVDGLDIFVAEHGSTDDTVGVAEGRGIKVISCPDPGKGCQVRHALKIINTRYKHIFMLDADYTYPAVFIVPMLWELEHGADVVAGVRKVFSLQAMPFLHWAWNRIAAVWLSVVFRHWVSDACTGMWGFKSSVIPSLNLCSDSFQLEVDIWSGALSANLRIEEVPIKYRARLAGESKAKISDAFPILSFALKRRFSRDGSS